jgi:hypothetical protein
MMIGHSGMHGVGMNGLLVQRRLAGANTITGGQNPLLPTNPNLLGPGSSRAPYGEVLCGKMDLQLGKRCSCFCCVAIKIQLWAHKGQ